MEIRKTIRLVGGVYNVELALAEGVGFCPITPVEQQKLNQFGEMKIDLGGEFEEDAEVAPLQFELPTNEVYLPSAFPVKQVFAIADYDDDEEAYIRAVTWRDTIVARVSASLTTLLAGEVGATGSEVDTLPTVVL